MAVILNCNGKKIGMNYCVLMRVSLVIVIMTRMQVQGWQKKRSRQENWQKR
jgi:hypothetical protein